MYLFAARFAGPTLDFFRRWFCIAFWRVFLSLVGRQHSPGVNDSKAVEDDRRDERAGGGGRFFCPLENGRKQFQGKLFLLARVSHGFCHSLRAANERHAPLRMCHTMPSERERGGGKRDSCCTPMVLLCPRLPHPFAVLSFSGIADAIANWCMPRTHASAQFAARTLALILQMESISSSSASSSRSKSKSKSKSTKKAEGAPALLLILRGAFDLRLRVLGGCAVYSEHPNILPNAIIWHIFLSALATSPRLCTC